MKILISYLRELCTTILAISFFLSPKADTGTPEFHSLEHNKMVNGQKCLSMHFKVNVQGMKGRDIKVIANVEHPKGTGIPDKNGKYCTNNGYVCATKKGTATYDNCVWKDFVINLPNNEIHALSGKRNYYIEALL
ncbi:MAG: hypothetical protein HDS27_02825 [Bacteroides sp.]|nr:hypothetical protein [Bacteroides sp.]